MTTLQGMKNVYSCKKCGKFIITIDRDVGVTPFMTACQRTKGCDGLAQSSFYRVDQNLIPTHEWYRMDNKEAANLKPSSRSHHEDGGLFLRPIKPAKNPNIN